jgi:3-deoxy-D-manno-octulosonic acid kinase
MAEAEVFKRDMQRVLLMHPKLAGRITFDWFDSAQWGDRAELVGSGGRGGAWFLDADGGDYVLREYLRGGLASRLSLCTYAFTGEDRVRSIMEFRMLLLLSKQGFPVPKPIAAYYRKLPVLRYQAAIIVERIANTAPLADLIDTRSDADWRRLGQLVRRFHDAGACHADLNCFNVLVRGNEFFLIDFDKGCIMPPNSPNGWKNRNLKRLARSIKKIAGEQILMNIWTAFEHGYNGSVAE